MKKYAGLSQLLALMASLLYTQVPQAADLPGDISQTADTPVAAADERQTPVELRTIKENEIPPNFFTITFYKPTYVLPYYYTGSPDFAAYSNVPQGDGLNNSEIKYQLSLKVPVWKDIFNRPTTLYLAYTQLSYWQAYDHTAFFRETDYEPELFFANEVSFNIKSWHINFINIGADHQSNGFGGTMERSWNRIYLEMVSSVNDLVISIKPWYVIHDSTYNSHNPNLTNFLGYGQILIAYKYYHQVFSLLTHNLIESGGNHATAEFTWSFPITSYLNGYVQVFSGYGQSLIEYNHRTNSAGIGIALSNWV
jgi:phospholipase A1/A2